MKLAVLGTDSDVLRLAMAAIGEGHEIVWVGDVRPADSDAVEQLMPGFKDRSEDWELLLDRGSADAVLVGRGTAPSDLRAEQLKRLAAEAVPLLVVHPACESVLTYYEVDMTRRETCGIVRHYNPLVSNPVVAEVAKWVSEGQPSIGPIHRITCERCLADIQRPAVMANVARDAELLAAVAGDICRVSAIGPRAGDTAFAALQVQMTCDRPVTLHWSVAPPTGDGESLILSLIGERGTVALRVGVTSPASVAFDRPDVWQIETRSAAQNERLLLEFHDAAVEAIQQLATAVATFGVQQRAGASTWDAATRAMEVADAVELSLEKGRTIEVFQQQLTERLAFRGTMAAMGCGLLLVGFFGIILVTLLGGAEGKDRPLLLPSWPIALLAVLALFLLMQTMPLLIAKTKRRGGAENDGAS
jgi:predicted dehydrogenase